MPRSPYPGFTALNRRRGDLIWKDKHGLHGLNPKERRELDMLEKVVDAIMEYACSHRDGTFICGEIEKKKKELSEQHGIPTE
jgi:hypothetical protein